MKKEMQQNIQDWVCLVMLMLLLTLSGCRTKKEKIESSLPMTDNKLGKKADFNNTRSYGEWTSSEFGGGGYVQQIATAVSNTNVLYVHTDVGGLYRSDNAGRRWRMLHGNMPAKRGAYSIRGINVDPRDENIILAASGNQWADPIGVLRSTDGGNSWKQVLSATFYGNGPQRADGYIFARNPINQDELIVGSAGSGIWRSMDNGCTWNSIGLTGINPTDIDFDYEKKNMIWICAQPFSPFRKEPLTGGLFYGNTDGKSWLKVAENAPDEIQQLPYNNSIVGIFSASEFKISSDKGNTWDDYSAGLALNKGAAQKSPRSDYRYKAIAAGPDFLLTASTKGKFYLRKSNANKWTGIQIDTIEELYEGRPWHSQTKPGKWQHFGSALAHITIDPVNRNSWFFTDWYALYKTSDAGKNWRMQMDGIELTVIHALAQDPSDPERVHMGMADNGCCISTDGGKSFRKSGINCNTKCFSVSPHNPATVYATGDRGDGQWAATVVWKSTDSGVTWNITPMTGLPVSKESRLNTICTSPRTPGTIWVAVSGEVSDGGGGPYISRDGGESWQWQGDGLPQNKALFEKSIWNTGPELAVSLSGNCIIAANDVKEIYLKDPKNKKWKQSSLKLKNAPHHIEADPFRPLRFFMAVLHDGLYRTDNGGKSWQRMLAANAHRIAVDRVMPDRIACSSNNGIYLSTDGGDSWKITDRSLPQRTGNIIAFAGNRLLAGSDGSGVFWMSNSIATYPNENL